MLAESSMQIADNPLETDVYIINKVSKLNAKGAKNWQEGLGAGLPPSAVHADGVWRPTATRIARTILVDGRLAHLEKLHLDSMERRKRRSCTNELGSNYNAMCPDLGNKIWR